ncbi:DUF7573 domain-containing protein [Halorussus marinus]|uniref:DUF7573 domain-containing protein n=1 Tax=Halorussus marinus TaxID=2505976 RepID=UPI00106DE93F|nr:hypothetical protein [Halorussus marinus]
MTEDASLDAFAASGEDDAGSDASDGESSAAADAPSVEPARSTYAWSPRGGECADCGESVERRWRDDGALVCGDCKEW